ncbi:MAG: NTP transferase domain-containing protein [Minicystis sp.]
MHGLVLAAGQGSRLAASGGRLGKPFIAVGGRTLLGGMLGALREIGCQGITCLVRAEQAEAARAIASWAGCPATRVLACLTPSSLHTLGIGLAAAPDGPVLAAVVDAVMPRADFHALARSIAADLADGADAVLAVSSGTDDERPIHVALDADRRVLEVSDDPLDPIRVSGGVYGLGPRARALARAAVDRGQSHMRSFLATLLKEGLAVRAVEVPRIVDVDRPADVLAADVWLRSLGEGSP